VPAVHSTIIDHCRSQLSALITQSAALIDRTVDNSPPQRMFALGTLVYSYTHGYAGQGCQHTVYGQPVIDG